MSAAEPGVIDSRGQRYLLLSTVSLGALIGPLNSTMLAVALPDIRDAFGVSHAAIGWLVSLYLIGMTVSQPIGGQLGDQLGRARVFRVALVLFIVSSVGAALAPSFGLLVLFRVGQAFTAAAVMPTGLAMLRTAVPVMELGRMNGMSGGIMSFSAAAGPVIGALAIALGSWRLLFLFNVPVVVISLLLLTRVDYHEVAAPRRASIDWLGAGLFAAALVLVSLLLDALSGGFAPLALLAVVAALPVVGLVLARQLRRHPTPAVDWQLFRSRTFSAASVSSMFVFLAIYLTLFTIPFFLVEVQDRNSATAGYLLGGMSFLMAFVAPFSGRLADSMGRRLPTVSGGALVAVASLALALVLSVDVPLVVLAIPLGVLGLGVGLASGPSMTAAIESVSPAMAGSAAGTNAMMRYMGSIVGVGIVAAVLSSGDAPGIEVFRLIIVVVTGMGVLAAIAALPIHRFPAEMQAQPEPAEISEQVAAST